LPGIDPSGVAQASTTNDHHAMVTAHPSRHIEYEFTCPNGHRNHGEELVFASTPDGATDIVLSRKPKCHDCGAPLKSGAVIKILDDSGS